MCGLMTLRTDVARSAPSSWTGMRDIPLETPQGLRTSWAAGAGALCVAPWHGTRCRWLMGSGLNHTNFAFSKPRVAGSSPAGRAYPIVNGCLDYQPDRAAGCSRRSGSTHELARTITPVLLPQTADEPRAAFAALKTRADIAKPLAVSDQELTYMLYRKGAKYIEFDVRKRSGEVRRISAPDASIKSFRSG
jgi:hypothetical protein